MERINDLLQKSIGEEIKSPSPLKKDLLESKPEQPNPKELWNKTLEILKLQLDKQIFGAWISPLEIGNFSLVERKNFASSAELTLYASNKFAAAHVEQNYNKLITKTLGSVLGTSNLSISYRVYDGSVEKPIVKELPQKKQPKRVEVKKDSVRVNNLKSNLANSNLNPKYNFSNLIVGDCNKFAHAASMRVSENLGLHYNPLFIYGGVGLGKTHLANAIGNAACRRGKKVLLVSSELFVSQLISALRSNSMPHFKNRFRSLDLLIIDDIQFLIGKERTQEEFFHTFNELHHKHSQIVITSDKVPQELLGLEERLRTRFASGLTCDLQVPDFETRSAILSKKAEAKQLIIPQDVAEMLAERIDTNIRELEGALNRLQAMSSLHNCPIDKDLALEVIKVVAPEKKQEVTTELIQQIVSEKFSVSVADIIGKRRTQNIASARQIAMYLCRKHTSSSFPEIGTLFGGRDHSTVIHACKVIEQRSSENASLKNEITEIEGLLSA